MCLRSFFPCQRRPWWSSFSSAIIPTCTVLYSKNHFNLRTQLPNEGQKLVKGAILGKHASFLATVLFILSLIDSIPWLVRVVSSKYVLLHIGIAWHREVWNAQFGYISSTLCALLSKISISKLKYQCTSVLYRRTLRGPLDQKCGLAWSCDSTSSCYRQSVCYRRSNLSEWMDKDRFSWFLCSAMTWNSMRPVPSRNVLGSIFDEAMM